MATKRNAPAERLRKIGTMEDAISTAIREAIGAGEEEVLTRAIAALLGANDYGHTAQENLTLLISAAIRNIAPDNVERPAPETIAGAVLDGLFLGLTIGQGESASFVGGKVAVRANEDQITLVTRGELPDEND